MGIKHVKPTTAGRRQAKFDDFSDITKTIPEKRLVIAKKRSGGRNAQGKITVRHRGGGAKRGIRVVDYIRDKFDIPARVAAIEYDPNRGARLALLNYKDGEKRYIVSPIDLKVGDEILSSNKKIEIKKGNAMPVEYIPAGVPIYNLEMIPGRGGRIARGAGNSVSVMGVEKEFAQVKLPSGEIRLINKNCLCTVGQASNPDKRHIKLGSAGRKRHLGIRPTVRGTVMNPVDHPHGGGEGNQSIGLKHPKTPWGKPALGVKTRRKKKASGKFIIARRGKKRK
ncbi:MAG: 50S ribosomal protein L2 [Candidatus Falkowbacteria bacterium GW2011_GWC2_38_22]|uniref:Large ribosomal subunit protein uL2 n=1 Tax=Candidatus Falkowbacteria bacterium GW2011_GWE1_38_31 TaxID=1618638 RepID=A0A0G0MYQ0_9BACT|nr:MAG: 50S ribosomal protein L2 [Candidatus Falkowbacteria bacterium GW2011_GWF2_38_1205]KKQ61189.1 MAG: 50S ribosomal protein L2 [Candidatus Falkowbacteria bacterium GW2011_GWC2_38_22]KKQ63304.1 MAG: 50S ribosomal protein L2 [Candidatus Falkowbacteria bacterium GW2011_GWF1_38_22]KKQ65578.1 MAG: 50S ribosomal protein L2 [Candidatus Falkowbacteria bacterium GW2011_GWE2_38_254]KKQ70036.1 MAG: 50S ribosomal protein L2 [Candidatus Falkowbacteria bacterium GW2011_GWE1_38_31]KKQ72723.1 MAG: 50S rib